jgi:hypothetical protein
MTVALHLFPTSGPCAFTDLCESSAVAIINRGLITVDPAF